MLDKSETPESPAFKLSIADARAALRDPKTVAKVAFLLVVLLGVIYAISEKYPIGVDWRYTFGPLWHHWRDPFDIPGLANPP